MPASGMGSADPESRTEELDAEDLSALDRWADSCAGRRPAVPSTQSGENAYASAKPTTVERPDRVEAGLRVCPRCGRPVHLNAVACRECGAPVPKR